MPRACRGDEDPCSVHRELQLAATAPAHLVAVASRGGLHCKRRICRQPLVPTRPVDDVRPEADATDAVVLEVDLGRPFVRQLEDPVQRGRLAGVLDPRPRVRPVDGGRARVGDAADAPPPGRLEDVGCSDDVDGGAAGRIGLHEREKHCGQVHDVRDPVLADRPFELLEVGDIAVDERQLLELLGRHDQLEPVPVRAEVVQDHRHLFAHELCTRPGADAAQRAGDQETLVRHASW